MTNTQDLPIPRYGEASLADLTPSLLAALGVPDFANVLRVAPITGVCVLLVDGLGWELLRSHASDAPFLNRAAGHATPLTAGFPSTTAASVASIGTGLPPGEHGIVGYTMAVPGLDRPLNTLLWRPYGPGSTEDLRSSVAPEQLQPQATAFERAAAAGVAVTLLAPSVQDGSGLTRAALRGGVFQEVSSLDELVAQAGAALRGSKPAFVYAYFGDLDRTGHVHGIASEAWRQQLARIDAAAASLARRLPAHTTLVVTADHGMVDLTAEQRLDLAALPELRAGVLNLGGEARARHVYTRPNAADDVAAAWRSVLGDRMWVLSREEAIAAGLFGPRVQERVRPRIGEVVALARDSVGIVWAAQDPGQARLVGHHGSVTAAEQLVPFLVLPSS